MAKAAKKPERRKSVSKGGKDEARKPSRAPKPLDSTVNKGVGKKRASKKAPPEFAPFAPPTGAGDAAVLDRLWGVVQDRRDADPAISHSARLLGRGRGKVAQKFGEEAVECLIEAMAGNREALVAESADVLYHLIVLWVDSGIRPEQVWAELRRREGVSGIAEKAARGKSQAAAFGVNTTKIP